MAAAAFFHRQSHCAASSSVATSSFTSRRTQSPETNLQGKVVLITGASAGIGRSCAWRFAEKDCKLVLLARRGELLDALKQDLVTTYPSLQVHTVVMSVTDLEAVAALPNKLPPNFADVYCLVNNAGLALGVSSVDQVNVTPCCRNSRAYQAAITHYLHTYLPISNLQYIYPLIHLLEKCTASCPLNTTSTSSHSVLSCLFYQNNAHDAKTMLDSNVLGTIAFCSAFVPGMKKRGAGHIVNMGSCAGQYAYANGSVSQSHNHSHSQNHRHNHTRSPPPCTLHHFTSFSHTHIPTSITIS